MLSSISKLCHTEDLKNGTCGLSNLVFGVDEWVQGNSSRAVLSLARHQLIIHCETSCVANATNAVLLSQALHADALNHTACCFKLKRGLNDN